MSDEQSVTMEPPGYPYPNEEIIYSSARNAPNFTVGEDSWFAVARMSETQEHIFNGRVHENPYRFVIHSPVAGSESFFVKYTDATRIVEAMFSLMADSDIGRESNNARLSEQYFNNMVADEYTVKFIKDNVE